MSTGETQRASPTTPRLKGWNSLVDRWSAHRETLGRFLKYSFLVLALLLTIKIVFDGYSYYVARRSIDAELDTKKIASLEYLNVLQRRERALMRETLETRCTERVEIALFRVFNVLMETKLKDYYAQTMAVKDPLVAEIKENGPKFLVGWKETEGGTCGHTRAPRRKPGRDIGALCGVDRRTDRRIGSERGS
jgi:hypothetical protein